MCHHRSRHRKCTKHRSQLRILHWRTITTLHHSLSNIEIMGAALNFTSHYFPSRDCLLWFITKIKVLTNIWRRKLKIQMGRKSICIIWLLQLTNKWKKKPRALRISLLRPRSINRWRWAQSLSSYTSLCSAIQSNRKGKMALKTIQRLCKGLKVAI